MVSPVRSVPSNIRPTPASPAVRESRARVAFVGLLLLVTILLPVDVGAAINNNPTALAFAQAIATDPAIITGASFVTKPPTTGTVGIGDTPLNSFPQHGTTYGILSSGNAGSADDGGQGSFASSGMGGGNVRGNTDYDVTIVRVNFNAPAGSDCLTITFRFMSEEYPEYVGGSFNEAFIAELDASTWSVSGTTITAPNNFAFDQNGNVVSINAVGTASMTAAGAAGTIYDGGTSLLQASKALSSGAHSLYLSIFDMADSSYDSAVFVDKLVVGTNGAGGCEEGAVPAMDPTAAFTFSPLSPHQGQTIQFTDGSTDPDGTVASWSWNFGDGTTSTLKNPTKVFADNGNYNVQLTVTDNSGATDAITKLVAVANLLPSVSFTFSPASPLQGQSVSFAATASDPDGTIASVSWTFGDGATGTGSSPSHVYADDGTYSATVTVTDDDGGTATQTKTIVVTNLAPTANFNFAPINPNQGTSVSFTDASTDSDGTITSRSWNWGDGTPSSTAQNPTHVFADDGSYTVTLTVTDDDGATAVVSKTVGVVNTAPVPDFSFSPTSPNQGATVSFTDLSVDPDGTIVSRTWSFGDGGSSGAVNPTYVFADDGTYSVTLTVTDDDGQSVSKTKGISVLNTAPVASFAFTPATPGQGATVTFTDQSTDSDGTITSRSWAFGDGATSSAINPTHVYADDGSYTVSLTVTDDDGTSSSKSLVVGVQNAAPIADFTSTPATPTQGQPVSFTDASTDTDGTIASRLWDFGDGATSAATNPAHAFADDIAYTVTLTVTDDDGATGTRTRVISVQNTLPVPDFSFSPASPNQGATVSFLDASTDPDGSITSRSWTFGDGGSSTGTNPTHVFADDGTYSVTLTVVDDDGGAASLTRQVTVVNTPPVAAFSFAPSSPNQGASVAFTDLSTDVDGTIVSRVWSFGDGTPTSAAANPSHVFADDGTYTVTLTVTDDDGATHSATKTVQVQNTLPTADFSFTPSAPNQGAPVTFTDLSSDSDGTIVSWQWDFGDGATSTATNPTHPFADDGSYTVILTVTDDDGGVRTKTVVIGVLNTAPVSDFAFSPSSPNQGATVSFTDLSSDADGTITTRSWTFGDGATSTAASPTHMFVDDGTYTVTLTVTDDDGAAHAFSRLVTVLNTPPVAQFTFSPAAPNQNLDTVQFTDASTDADGTVDARSWDFGDGATSTALSPSHVYTDAGSYTVTLTVTDNDGASHAKTALVVVSNTPPVADFSFSPATPNQILDTVSFVDLSTDPDGTVDAHSWNLGDGATSTATNPTHVYADDGAYTVTLTVTDDDGSTSTRSRLVVVVNTAPVADFSYSPAMPTQIIDTVQFTDLSTDIDGGIAARSWSFGDGATSTAASPAHIYGDAGSYTVTLTVTDVDGTSHVKSVVVEVQNAQPAADFQWTPATPNQGLDTVAFADLSTDADGTLVAWAWDFGDGGASTAQHPSYTYAQVGTYTVTLSVTDDDGEVHAASKLVTVVNTLPVADFSFAPNTPNQGLDTVQFTDLSSDVDGEILDWAWTFGDGAASNAQNPSHVYAQIGEYTVQLVVTDDDGDAHSVTKFVNVVNTPPVADFSFAPNTPVQGLDTVQFTDLSSDSDGALVAWSWDFGDGGSSTLSAPTHVYADIGTYTVQLSVTDDDGDVHTMTHSIVVINTAPVADFTFTPAKPRQILDTVVFTDASTDVDGMIVAWSWDFGDGAASSAPSPSHVYGEHGTYMVSLTVTDDDGMTHTKSVLITVLNTRPVADFSFLPAAPVQNLDTVQFTDLSYDVDGVIVAWTWDFGDGDSSTTQHPTHVFADNAAYWVTLTVTDDDGDTRMKGRLVHVINIAPVSDFSFSPQTPNQGLDTVQFTDLATDADGFLVARSWAFGDGATSTAANPTHTYADIGTYTVTLTVTDDDGATHTRLALVTVVNTAPVADFGASADTVNQDLEPVDFTDLSSDADGIVVAWAWDFGDGATSSAPSPTHVFAAVGTYTVTLTVTDDDGASDSHAIFVTVVNTDPVADFGYAPGSPNQGEAVVFTDLSSDVDGNVVGWSWSFGDGATSTAPAPTHAFADIGSYTVILTVTDDDGASSTRTALIEAANTLPVADWSYEPALPAQILDTVAFSDLSTDADGSVVSWAWAFGDGATATGSAATHVYADAGTYTATLTVTDDDGGVHQQTYLIEVVNLNPTADASFAPSMPGQILDTVQFADLSSDADGTIESWAWDFGDGASSSDASPTHVYADSGVYTATLVVTDDDGATDTTVLSVEVLNAPPIAFFDYGPRGPNQGQQVAFTDASSDTDGTIVAWVWDFGDGTTSSEPSPGHAFADIGAYEVTLTVTDDDGATHSASSSVQVVNTPPVAAFTATPDPANQLLESVQFTDQSSDADGAVVVWAWSLGDGSTSSSASPAHTYADVGVYTVSLTVTDDDGATRTQTGSVQIVNTPPEADWAYQPAAPVQGMDEVVFTNLSSDVDGTVVAWAWDFGDGNSSSLASPNHTYADAGLYIVTLTVTDDDGADSTRTMGIEVLNIQPVAGLAVAPNPAGQLIESVMFTDLSSDTDGDIVAWLWDFGDGATSAAADPTHVYADAGSYVVTLTVTDDDGATATALENVEILNTDPSADFTFAPAVPNQVLDAVLFADLSADLDGTIASWFWDFGDGSNATEQAPTHAYADVGTYTVTFTVTDDDGATAAASHDVTVVNTPPVSAFAWDPLEPLSLTNATFTDLSSDVDGAIVAWLWDFGDDNNSTLPSPVHVYARPGSYSVSLLVTDDDGASTLAMETVTILNRAPTALFTATPAIPTTSDVVSFADLSFDLDGQIEGWLWDFGDGNTSAAAEPQHQYADDGLYNVTLSVTDDQGANNTAFMLVVVLNVGPVAEFLALPGMATTQETISFTDQSYDSDGAVVSWFWNLGDGTTSTNASVAHQYASQQAYNVCLTVTDDDGASASTCRFISVIATIMAGRAYGSGFLGSNLADSGYREVTQAETWGSYGSDYAVGPLQAGDMEAVVEATVGRVVARAEVGYAGLTVLGVGGPLEIRLQGTDIDLSVTCRAADVFVRGYVEVLSAGTTIFYRDLAGAKNTVHELPGGIVLRMNEQRSMSGVDVGMVVRALVVESAGDETVIGYAQAGVRDCHA